MIRRPLCLDCSVPATWHRYKTAKGTVPLCGFSERISKGSKVQFELSAAETVFPAEALFVSALQMAPAVCNAGPRQPKHPNCCQGQR